MAVASPAPNATTSLTSPRRPPGAAEQSLSPFPPRIAGPARSRRGRLSGSAWLFVRDQGGASLAGSGQLGGSQAGVRLSYSLGSDPAAGPALFARLSSPLEQSRGKEVAIGLDWQPSPALPLRLSAERRVGLDEGGRDAFAVGLAGGVSDAPLPAGLRLTGYAQAGIVGARKRDAYVEGGLRVGRPVATLGETELSAGVGAWGGAQPGVERLDLGPQLELRFRAAGQPLRLNLDWRQRIAGEARPGSGPALTLAADF